MPDFTTFLIAVGPLAIGITKVVDFVRSFDSGDTWPKGIWIALALVLGVTVAVVTATNFSQEISGFRPEISEALSGTWGEVVTGLAIGATSSFWHEHMSATSSRQTLNEATAASE